MLQTGSSSQIIAEVENIGADVKLLSLTLRRDEVSLDLFRYRNEHAIAEDER